MSDQPVQTVQTLPSSIASGAVAQAVATAVRCPVEEVLEVLTWDVLDAHPELASQFLQRWVAGLPAPVQLQAAVPVSAMYVLALAHLPDARRTGADLLLGAQRSAAAFLADSLSGFRVFTDGPDAHHRVAVAVRLDGYAEVLRGMDFGP